MNTPNRDETAELRDAYLTLLRDAVQHTLFRPIDAAPLAPHVEEFYALTGLHRQLAGVGPDEEVSPLQMRELGLDNPVYAVTLLSTQRLDSLRSLVEQVIADEVPGDLCEAGVWRGGASIFMKGVLRAWGDNDRRLVLADSFEGLPRPDLERFPLDKDFGDAEIGRFGAGREEVEGNFRRFGVLDDRVEFVEGWFEHTLPGLRERSWALLRFDGDLYQSTAESFENLYDGLSPGGFVIVDDYAVDPCKAAVHDFRDKRGITDPIERPDWASAYWRKT